MYIDCGHIKYIYIANTPAQGPTSSVSWCQEHLARILDVFLDTNCTHAGVDIICNGYVSEFTNQ